MRPLIVITLVTIATICAAQAPPKKPSRKTQTAPHSSFVCPDTEAQKACKSYQELLKSKDPGFFADLLADRYVCFRKDEDEFFLISISKPYFRKRWDQDLKQMVIDSESTPPGHGYASSYKDGVEKPTLMPNLLFSGRWYPYSESGTFVADKINFKKQDENDHDVGISIDESQINIGYKYENTFGKTVQYNLTIQRSTGRFVESFKEQERKVPISEHAGYCTHRKADLGTQRLRRSPRLCL